MRKLEVGDVGKMRQLFGEQTDDIISELNAGGLIICHTELVEVQTNY